MRYLVVALASCAAIASYAAAALPASPPAAQTATGTARAVATPGTITRDTELKAEPFVDAKTLAKLVARSRVSIVDRRGGWLQVVSGNARGWVRLLHVTSGTAAAGAPTAKELEAAARVATGRAGTGNIAVTTGIRGLTTEQLQGAKPNPAELQHLETYGIEPAQANAYAAQQKLERQQIPYPPAPGERRNAQP